MTGWNMPPGCSTNDPYFQDGPDITMLKEKIVTARKEHKCYMCREPIKVGDKYHYFAYKDHYDNKFKADHGHIMCPWEEGHP